jgi:hypothetical protein
MVFIDLSPLRRLSPPRVGLRLKAYGVHNRILRFSFRVWRLVRI